MISTDTPAASGTAADKKSTERFYRPELDLLRFFAFFSVFGFHISFFLRPWPARWSAFAGIGAYGMCLFFFLSSYLITELLLRERVKSGTIHVRAFFIRRVLRIWPLYFAFIGLTICLGYFDPRFRISLHHVAALISLSGNWYMARHGPDPSPASPLWSISLEEQFYLVWPFLARFGGSRMLGRVSILLIPCAWIVLALHSGVAGYTDQTIWCNSFVQFHFFALGALTALGLHRRFPRWRPSTRVAILLAGACAWLSANELSRVNYAHGLPGPVLIAGYLLIGGGCLCLLLGLLGLPGDVVPRRMVYLGQISYGLYVFHELNIRIVSDGLNSIAQHTALLRHAAVFDAAELSLSFALTVCVAAASYRFYEHRFLKLKERFAFIRTR